MNKKWGASGAFVLVLIASVGWAMGFFDGKDPQLAELEQMRDLALQNRDNGEYRAEREQFREKVGQLSEEQRKQFFENSRPMFQQMMNQRMNKFFAMTEEEQNVELDKLIERMENRSRDGKVDGKGVGRNWGGKGLSQQGQDNRRQKRLDNTTPEMRAKFDKFKDMMNDRREERGLPPRKGPWRHFGRG
jgi:hypothetical protein